MQDQVAVLYICTGQYSIFWKEFYKSCERHFLPNYNKQYYIFTDAPELFAENAENVHKIYQPKLEFPKDSLMRFDMFLKVKEQLQDFSHIYFFNANIIFVKNILPEEVFPSAEENGLIGYQHAGEYKNPVSEFIYERNPVSTAYVKEGTGKYYYQGCFIGGKAKEFLQMCKELDENIKQDLENDFIAVWWDESHLNRYLLDKKVKLLHPGYAYPELWDLPFEKKAIMLDKTRRTDINILRGIEKQPKLYRRFKHWLKQKFIPTKY
jgi:hypothetical protein